MAKIIIKPQGGGVVRVEGVDYSRVLRRGEELESQGEYAAACELRFDAVQRFMDTVGEESPRLDWEDKNTRSLIELCYRSAADHLQVGETEMAAALWECVIDMDEEDHFEANVMLAFVYVALEDWDCLESARFSISSKTPEYHLLALWESYVRSGEVDRGALKELSSRHKEWWTEFTSEQHPVDEAYKADCLSERPSKRTEAREFWFATEPLWASDAEFLEKVRVK